MLYDFGGMRFLSESAARLVVLAVLVGCAAGGCVLLAVAVRIGNLIIGW
jgi:hypothetical protein